MPSRKRNKGKERKAKKQAEQAEVTRAQVRLRWRRWARGEVENINGVAIQCNHGCHTIRNDPAGHPALDLLDVFFMNWAANIGVLDNLKDTLQKQPQAWDNHNYREMVTKTLIRIGTNMLLTTNELSWPGSLAIAIAVLEDYEEVGDIDSAIYSRRSAKKLRNLQYWNISSMKRDLLKFYRKRMSCSCLKAMHLEARKTLPQLGACCHCEVVTDRALLMVCSRCRCHHYCSRECQVAAWDEHKPDCDLFDRVHNQQSK